MGRLFYAAILPAPVLQQLTAVQKQLQQNGVGGRLIPGDMLHLTLHFLGPVPDSRVHQLSALLDTAAAHMKPFTVNITGLGWFRQSKGRLIFADARVSPELNAVADTLKTSSGMGDLKPFRPHITLVRGAVRVHVPSVLEGALHIEGEISRLALYESVIVQGRPAYRRIHTTELNDSTGGHREPP
ncbi:MAG: RNA 2',3'-cyclic phosphodiesterase [Spirochaetales bacterium]|nr:RNA 2',3'-cyclic phosphodiesterase [Spirochaetales bacterium]